MTMVTFFPCSIQSQQGHHPLHSRGTFVNIMPIFLFGRPITIFIRQIQMAHSCFCFPIHWWFNATENVKYCPGYMLIVCRFKNKLKCQIKFVQPPLWVFCLCLNWSSININDEKYYNPLELKTGAKTLEIVCNLMQLL